MADDSRNDVTGGRLRTDVAHSARIYDYLLGGKDNFPVDREAAADIHRVWPSLPVSMRANRRFVARVVRWLAAERGVRQFLDVGTGLPTEPNLHQVAQAVHPDARVLYVDNDPMVLVHARALLTGSAKGVTRYLDADLREPHAILDSAAFAETLDPAQPVAVSLFAILQFVTDESAAAGIIGTLMEAMPSGSFLALSTVTGDSNPEEVAEGLAVYAERGIPELARDRAAVERLFTGAGLELLDPGVQLVHRWRPADGSDELPDAEVQMYGGVAVKP